MSEIGSIQRANVTSGKAVKAFLGHATGMLLTADGIEVIVVAKDRDELRKYIAATQLKPHNDHFVCPVAVVQRKDVVIDADEDDL